MKYLSIALVLVVMLACGTGSLLAAPVPGSYAHFIYYGDGAGAGSDHPYIIESASDGSMTGTLLGTPFSNGSYSGGSIALTTNLKLVHEGSVAFSLVGHRQYTGQNGSAVFHSDTGTLLVSHTLT